MAAKLAMVVLAAILAEVVCARQTLSVGVPPAGSLDENAEKPPSGTSVCTFNVHGSPSSSANGTVQAASIEAEVAAGSELSIADISCSGPSITIQGGPALETFAEGWQGVTYVKNVQLPGSTMTLRGEDVVIEDSYFVGLQSFGSAAIVFAASNVTFLNATFHLNNNSAAGCVYANESSLVQFLDSEFSSNAGGGAGTIALWNSSGVVNNTIFTNNTCNSGGGAFSVNNGSSVLIAQSQFLENSATNGGAVYLETCGHAVIFDNIFEINTAEKSGGAIFQQQCPGNFSFNTYIGNDGTNGGAVWHNDVASVEHTQSIFTNNTATSGCAGIEINQVPTLSISYNNFTGGKGSKGGAIYMQNSAGNITSSYFANNNATFGGAIFRGTSSGNVDNNVFTANSASSDGGAIYDSHVQGDIDNNQFSKNKATKSGAAVFRTASSGSLSNNGDVVAGASQVTITDPSN